MFKGVIGIVIMAGIVIAFINAALVQPGGGAPAEVEWVDTVQDGDDGKYYIASLGGEPILVDGGVETHWSINNPNGTIYIYIENVSSTLTITGSDVHLGISGSDMAGSLDWSSVTNINSNWVDTIGSGAWAGSEIKPGWASD